MTSLFRVLRTAAMVGVSVVLAACGGDAPDGSSEAATGVRLAGAGATFPDPLYQEWIRRYRDQAPDVRIRYQPVGSGEGVARFLAETVDFGGSDRAMTDAEMAQVVRGARLIPATAGMVVLAYNLPEIDGELRLPRDVYVDIFLGTIWRWDDPRIQAANPDLELPSKMIQTVVRRDGSGTTYAFTNHLSAVSDAWRYGPGTGQSVQWPGGAMTGSGNEGVAQKIKISPGSIGYVEYYFARRLEMPIAMLENRAGRFVRPDAATGQAALASAAAAELPDNLRLFVPDPSGSDDYPIVSLSWLLLYGEYPDTEVGESLKAAVNWALDQGQEIAEEMGYIPLPEAIAAAAVEAVASIR
ncbi:phosphate ABC transporter substrate-binding protein PstS [Thioalkalicoccus limnaeus]|uniref:Phosphate-binding protein PstS n=1 Tax=Thioalkalicoccus limnaeus TaxID=120681 RepID=A0ABV4BDG6_9GAMM